MRGWLSFLLMLSLVAVLVVTGCHAHSFDPETTVHPHCTLCDLGLAFTALLTLLLALLGRVRSVAARLRRTRVARRGAFRRCFTIRPPPSLLFA